MKRSWTWRLGLPWGEGPWSSERFGSSKACSDCIPSWFSVTLVLWLQEDGFLNGEED